MEETLQELIEMSDEELIERHDKLAKRTVVGSSYYLDEYHRRFQQRQTETMLKLTTQLKWLTVLIAGFTIASFIFLAYSFTQNC